MIPGSKLVIVAEPGACGLYRPTGEVRRGPGSVPAICHSAIRAPVSRVTDIRTAKCKMATRLFGLVIKSERAGMWRP
jgi:hypothetical protein